MEVPFPMSVMILTFTYLTLFQSPYVNMVFMKLNNYKIDGTGGNYEYFTKVSHWLTYPK